MTAYRVIDDHSELDNVGTTTHVQLDAYINTTGWVVASGSTGPFPPSARKLVAGSGVTITDSGPGGTLTIAAGVAGSIEWNEIPSGSNNGSNKAFTLAYSPSPSNSLMLFINGVKQRQGADSDYTLTGSLINLITNYRSGSNIDATYPR